MRLHLVDAVPGGVDVQRHAAGAFDPVLRRHVLDQRVDVHAGRRAFDRDAARARVGDGAHVDLAAPGLAFQFGDSQHAGVERRGEARVVDAVLLVGEAARLHAELPVHAAQAGEVDRGVGGRRRRLGCRATRRRQQAVQIQRIEARLRGDVRRAAVRGHRAVGSEGVGVELTRHDPAQRALSRLEREVGVQRAVELALRRTARDLRFDVGQAQRIEVAARCAALEVRFERHVAAARDRAAERARGQLVAAHRELRPVEVERQRVSDLRAIHARLQLAQAQQLVRRIERETIDHERAVGELDAA